jgi:hypothetical protein
VKKKRKKRGAARAAAARARSASSGTRPADRGSEARATRTAENPPDRKARPAAAAGEPGTRGGPSSQTGPIDAAADAWTSTAGAKQSPARASEPPSSLTAPDDADDPGADATSLEALDARVLPIVTALARIAREPGSTLARLERAVQLLLDAYATADADLSRRLLAGWLRAREDKQWRLRLAWQREQIRLALQDILAEGTVRGELRTGLDVGAVAAVVVGTAESALLQVASEGGPVGTAELARTLVDLTRREA